MLELASTHVFLPVTGDAQRDESECRENGNGNHMCAVIQSCVAIAILCLYSDLSTLLYNFAKSKTCVTPGIFKYINVVLIIKPSLCRISKRTWSESIAL